MDPDPDSDFPFLTILSGTADFLPETGVVLIAAIFCTGLLLLAALIAGSELALLSSRESLLAQNESTNRRIRALIEDPRSLRATVLIVTTIANVSATILAAALAGALAASLGWNAALILALQVALLSLVIVVFTRTTPRLLAPRWSYAFSRSVSGPLHSAHRTWAPITLMLAKSSDSIRERMKHTQKLSNEELKAMADVGEAQGTIEQEERELIHSIVEFGETTVREIMISRVDMVALPITASVPEAVELIRSSGHSRLPLYVEHLDNIAGVLYAKDLLPYLGADHAGHLDWTRLARQPVFVPPGKQLDGLLREFQARKTHLAIVVDEYGGTAGLVTLEDVLEEIVGDIRDEHDEFEPVMYEELEPGVYRVDGRIDLDDLDEMIREADFDADQYDFETLGGLIFHLAGAIPEEGEEVEFEGISLRVESRENHRIGRVLIRVLSQATKSSDAKQDDRS